MILCQFSFATNDAMVKYVYQSYNEIFVLNQIIFLRGIFALFLIGLFSQKKILFPLFGALTAASAVGKISPSLFALNGIPEVNKTSIKKNAKYLALMNPIVNF